MVLRAGFGFWSLKMLVVAFVLLSFTGGKHFQKNDHRPYDTTLDTLSLSETVEMKASNILQFQDFKLGQPIG